jgi:hypothetical protein
MTRIESIAPAPLALDYASSGDGSRSRHATRRDLARLALALPGLVVPFVDFTYGTSPIEVVIDPPGGSFTGDWMIYLLACSFFAAIPIVAWQVRQLAWRATPRRGERVMLTVAALIATAPAVGVVGMMIKQCADEIRTSTPPGVDGQAILMITTGLAPLAIGFALAAWRWRRAMQIAAAESLLVTGYLANAAMCLLGFHDDPELGYWLAIAPTAAFALDLLRPRRQSEE